MTALWTAAEFAAAAGGTIRGQAPATISGISIDSRTVAPGEAFVAIRGDRFDGHDYVAAALKAGAALALVQDRRAPDGAAPLLVVPDDPLAALSRIGAAARARTDAAIVAVTGSVGKTGTKEMLRAALSSLGQTHAPVASFNNHWGVPLTLARMPAATAYGVFEIGMNHAGEIRPLTRLVQPQVAIVTNVEPVHLAFFDGEAAIADAKAEIFEGLKPGGTAIINRDNCWFDRLAARAKECGARVVSFGEHGEADIQLESVTLDADGSQVTSRCAGVSLGYILGAPGRHLVQNSLAVLAAIVALGLDPKTPMAALADFRAPKGRGERHALSHPGGAFTLIDESYNANPTSMRAALTLLGQSRPAGAGRRIAVLGDMRELGDSAEGEHRGLAEPIAAAGVDAVFLAGPLMAALWRDLPKTRREAYAEDAAALQEILLAAVGPGDVVMVKASLGTKLGPLVEALKQHFGAAAC